jgi:hypothetical protein
VALARRRPAAVALQLACLARVVRGTDISPAWALAAPAGGLFLAAVGAAAALDRARGRARWRGRPIQSSSPSST